MPTVLTLAVGLTAYGLLWRYAVVKRRRQEAEARRLARVARRGHGHVSEITVGGPYQPTFGGLPVVYDDRIPPGSFALVDADGRIKAWGSI